MNNSTIIQALQQNPRLNIRDVADKLKLTTFQVSEAQHYHLKAALAKNRISPAWDRPDYNCNGFPWLKKVEMEDALNQIKSGEKGVYRKLLNKFRISTVYKEKILTAQAN